MVLRLIRMLNLFPSVGTKVIKHYTTVEVQVISTGSGFLGDPYGLFFQRMCV